MKVVLSVLIILLCLLPPVYVNVHSMNNLCFQEKSCFLVSTPDGCFVTLYRYMNNGLPILMIPGMFENHVVFDYSFSEKRSLAKYLAKEGYDVWILDLRTHDGDGDPGGRNRENICRYWDFDNTYLKQDVVTAVSFIKNVTSYDKLLLLGHSMGGYLAYAYAEQIRQDDLAGIVTIGSCGVGYRMDPTMKLLRTCFGKQEGEKVVVSKHAPSTLDLNNKPLLRVGTRKECFFDSVTKRRVQRMYVKSLDDEPAGVVVDMLYGFDGELWSNHWADPQTGYDYTKKLSTIRVPVLMIAGSKDESDPPGKVMETFELVGTPVKEFHVIKNYGHVDLLLGNRVSVDVFPVIKGWLTWLNEA